MFRSITLAAVAALAFTTATAAAAPAYIAKAVADSQRPAADKEADSYRKPAAMLRFAGVKPGDTVVDLMPGGGYFTRLFAKAVGPKGHVYAYEPQEFVHPGRTPAIDAVAGDYKNVTVVTKPIADFAVPAKADIVWTSQNYHDLHNAMMGPVDMAKFDKQVFDALKPGGHFIVLDHRAKAGTGTEDTSTLHRIDPAVVKTEVEGAGFKYVGESKALANPKDDLTKKVFDPAIRHHTDQFIFKFEKPKT